MAAALLAHLRNAVNKTKHVTPPLTDEHEATQDLFVAIDKVFLFGPKGKWNEKKGYWDFFRTALGPGMPGVSAVASMDLLKTSHGRGRAFIRLTLVHKKLAEHLQVAIANDKALDQFYTKDSIFRNKQLSDDLLDILYDLNEISFSLDTKTNLDDGWPSFASKTFAPMPILSPQKSSSSARDTTSLSTSPKSVAGSQYGSVAPTPIKGKRDKDKDKDKEDVVSMAALSMANSHWEDDLEQLRQERDTLRQEKEHLQADRTEADAVWNDMVAALKDKNLELKARIAELEQEVEEAQEKVEIQIAPTSAEQPSDAAASAQHTRESYEEQIADLRGLLENSVTQDVQRELEDEWRRREHELLARIQALEAEGARTREESTQAREQLEGSVRELQEQIAQKDAAYRELEEKHVHLTESKRHAAEEHVVALKKLEQEKNKEIETLRTLHATVQRVVADLEASLQSAERARAAAVARVGLMEQSANQERERADGAERTLFLMRKAIVRVTQDKVRIWQKAHEISDALQRFAATAAGVWQEDDAVLACNDCQSLFSFTLRRHHCRMCGRIFCNDCVSSWTVMAGSKKSVRVCAACNELLGSLKDGPLSLESSTINIEDDAISGADESTASGKLVDDTATAAASAAGILDTTS